MKDVVVVSLLSDTRRSLPILRHDGAEETLL